MANKMLIDASHPEETRVVVLRGNKVQEFDFEAADKKPLRGNIYLAKVTRVEPSLQAAFVDYGGNRHGFLAFAEIHPDYYQIPVADRIALLEEESRAHRQAEEEEHRPQQQGRGRRSRRRHADGAEKRSVRDDGVIVGPAPEASPFEGERQSAGVAETQAADMQPLEAHNEQIKGFETSDSGEVAADFQGPDAQPGETAFSASDRVSLPAGEEAKEIPNETVHAETGQSDEKDQEREDVSSRVEGAEPLISIDPSGFGVVEVSSAEEIGFEPIEQDHELKARRQDERDEEHERAREEARKRPSHDDDHDDDHEHDDEADHVEHIGGDAMEEVPFRNTRSRRQ